MLIESNMFPIIITFICLATTSIPLHIPNPQKSFSTSMLFLYFLLAGILTNDTVEGDPTFTVPLLTFRNEDHTLCYEIHGEANRFLNLVSDICVSVNAHYVERPNPRPGSRRPLNIIDQIAVRATDSMGKCVNIVVNLVNGECQAMVGTQNLSNNGTMFVENRLSVRSYQTMARISVPNCENVRLVMRVYCELTNGVHMIRYHINRGYNLRPTSHGLVGMLTITT